MDKGYELLKNKVLDQGLCTYCGTCVGVCPAHTLRAKRELIIDEKNNCINCNLCNQVCPGAEFDYKYFHKKLYSDLKENYDYHVGYYRHIYKGYTNDPELHKNGSGGGIITQLLVSLLEHGYADEVITTGDLQIPSISTSVMVMHKREEIIVNSGSKYILSPNNVVLQEILRDDKKYIYVGLPCQIQGLQKAMDIMPKLKSKVVLTIGLFCGFNMAQQGTKFLIKKSRFLSTEIKSVKYRKKFQGQTGFYINSSKGVFFVPKHGYTFLNLFFSPKRCLSCYDYTAEFADISVGDAWECEKSSSRVIIRSERAEQIISQLCKEDVFHFEDSSVEDITKTQKMIITHKKYDFWLRKRTSKNFPDYNIDDLSIQLSKKELRHAFLMSFILNMAHSMFGQMLLNVMPLGFFKEISKRLRK